MAISKEQADAISDALIAPVSQEAARLAALRGLRRRRKMPLRWRLVAIVAGSSVGALLSGLCLRSGQLRFGSSQFACSFLSVLRNSFGTEELESNYSHKWAAAERLR